MSGLDRSEYEILRATIARRGSLRPVLMVAGISAWAAVLTAHLVWFPMPIGSVIPLMILVATFEAIRPLHFGAERIGRYLQVFYEEHDGSRESGVGSERRPLSAPPSWERTAMVFGKTTPGAGGNPLFSAVFALATVGNYLAVLLPRPVQVELIYLTVPHAAFLIWLLKTNRDMRAQRAIELDRYRSLKNSG